MQDNFNLKGYLRNNKLLNESIGGYVDLRPINHLSEDFGEDPRMAQMDMDDDFNDAVHNELSSEESAWYTEYEDLLKKAFGRIYKNMSGDPSGLADEIKTWYSERQPDGKPDVAVNEADDDSPFGMPEVEEKNSWMEDVDGTENYTVGNWKCYYDYPGVLAWSYGDTPFDQLAVYATPGFDGNSGTPIQIDVNEETTDDEITVPQRDFENFEEYASVMKDYLRQIETDYATGGMNEVDSFIQAQRDAVGAKGSSLYGDDNENDVVTIELDMAWDADEDDAAQAAFDQYGIEVSEIPNNPGTYKVTGRKEDLLGYLRSDFYEMDPEDIQQYYPELLDGELEELEKPEKIYADDDEEYGNQDRMFDLGGQQIEQGIIDLLEDGFEANEVLEMCKMFIDAHSQGKKY